MYTLRFCAEEPPYYEKLKEMFIKEDIGIYDDTPDIGRTIALSDVYVGDSSTSVTMDDFRQAQGDYEDVFGEHGDAAVKDGSS